MGSEDLFYDLDDKHQDYLDSICSKYDEILKLVLNSELSNKFDILNFHKIKISNPQQWKIYTLTLSQLQRGITIAKSNGFLHEIQKDPLKLIKLLQQNVKVGDGKTSNSNPDNILSRSTTRLMNESEFLNYQKLSIRAKGVAQKMNIDVISRDIDIDNNICKLILAGNFTDKEILYHAFSYNVDLNEEEKVQLLKIINIVLSSILYEESKIR